MQSGQQQMREGISQSGDPEPASSEDIGVGSSNGGGGGGAGHNNTAARVKRIDRSCALCHRRKVRCDKKLPCSTCTRMGVLCCYPSRAKAAPRKEKTTISGIADRLAQLERTLVAISSSSPSKSEDGNAEKLSLESFAQVQDNHDASEDAESTTSERPPFGMLVNHGDGESGHYVNEVLLSRVLEEEREIRSVLTTPKLHESSTPEAGRYSSPPPRLSGSLGLMFQHTPSPGEEGAHLKYYPPKWLAIKLWQTFVQNVDSLNKLLHIPTVQITIYSAINNPENAPADVRCLLYAVFFSATTSITPGEAFNLLGQDKMALLAQFKAGLEISFAAADFFDNPSIMALQALALYLQIVRAHNSGRSIWILNGIAIRVAQSLGLHRDPSKFGLSPFESEVRRRLWWHIVTHDGRAAEDHGLAVNTFDPTTDTRLPLAVDDNALDPAMTELPVPPVGRFTEMTMATLIYEASYALQRLYRMLPISGFGDPDASASEAARKEVMDKLKARVQSQLACCNTVVPVQRAVSLIVRSLVAKVDFVSRQQCISLRSSKGKSSEAHVSEESLVDACQILEMNIEVQSDELMRNYRWTGEMYPQYHIMLYVLWHLGVRPLGPNVKRAWRAVDGAFDLEDSRRRRQDVSSGFGTKWAVLKALREKALRTRGSVEHSASRGGEAEAVEEMVVDSETFGWDRAFEDKLGMGWEGGFLDWEGLVDGLHTNNYDAPGSAE